MIEIGRETELPMRIQAEFVTGVSGRVADIKGSRRPITQPMQIVIIAWPVVKPLLLYGCTTMQTNLSVVRSSVEILDKDIDAMIITPHTLQRGDAFHNIETNQVLPSYI